MKGRKYTKKASGCCRWFLGDFSLFPSCLSTILSMFFFHNKFFFNPVHFILKKKALRENTLQSFYVLSRRVHNQTQYTCNALTIGKLPHGSYILYSLVGVTSDCLKQLKIVLKENGNGVTFFSRECHKIASSSNPGLTFRQKEQQMCLKAVYTPTKLMLTAATNSSTGRALVL